MRAVIFGGSAGMGRAIAEQLASVHVDVLLIASDARDLEAVQSDLLLRYDASRISTLAIDLTQVAPDTVARDVLERFGKFDAMFLVAGAGDDDDCGVLDPATAACILNINFAVPASLINALLAAEALLPNGAIVVLSSVAAARARGRNVLYGASKRGLEQYLKALRVTPLGLQYQFLIFRLGYLDTAMMQHRQPWLPKASPTTIARKMVAKIGGQSGLRYLPGWWRMIAWCVNLLPTALLRRLGI